MDLVTTTALWLSVVFSAWAVVTSVADGSRDARLVASGERGLHAALALVTIALVLIAVEERSLLADAPSSVALAITARLPWTDAATRLTLWAVFAAAGAVAAAGIVRREASPVRARTQSIAGVVALVFSLAAAGARYALGAAPDADVIAPVAVHTGPGIAARLLYVAGCAATIVPIAVGTRGSRRETAFRWMLTALALTAASLTIAAWVRYAAVAPAAELTAEGMPATLRWSSLSALWVVVPLLVCAAAFALAGPDRSRRELARVPRGWMALLSLAVAAILMLAAVAPAIEDWTAAREAALGFEVHPPLLTMLGVPVLGVVGWAAVRQAMGGGRAVTRLAAWAGGAAVLLAALAMAAGTRDGAALLGVALAGAAAGALLAAVGDPGSPRRRALVVAQGAVLVTIGAGFAATSVPPVQAQLTTGSPERLRIATAEWTFTSQGASQVELPPYDAAVVAFEIESGGEAQLLTTGERIYRDAHGHAGARVAVPGVLHRAGGDLRVVPRGIRGDVAMLQVQYHPLATLAFIAAAVSAAALLVAAIVDGSRLATATDAAGRREHEGR